MCDKYLHTLPRYYTVGRKRNATSDGKKPNLRDDLQSRPSLVDPKPDEKARNV